MKCSFCIVPKTRGKERYRSIHDIVHEAKELSFRGVKEITLLGQIVNAYGRGEFPRIKGKSPFVQLLEELHDVEGIERIRFTSPHPVAFGSDLVEAFVRLPKLGHYAHLPMQSGSNRILKSMKRPYTTERFQKIVRNLRTACPEIRLSTDVIVGYPGETEEDFNQTKAAFEVAGFEMGFIFKYSEREGTSAAIHPDKVPQDVKERRNQELLTLLEKQSLASNLKLVGNRMEILVEAEARKGNGDFLGRTKCFRKVLFPGHQDLIGELIEVKIEDANHSGLRGIPD
jgi:tRNA-2-methylthio-N6-dimethylallyladenosine synthase